MKTSLNGTAWWVVVSATRTALNSFAVCGGANRDRGGVRIILCDPPLWVLIQGMVANVGKLGNVSGLWFKVEVGACRMTLTEKYEGSVTHLQVDIPGIKSLAVLRKDNTCLRIEVYVLGFMICCCNSLRVVDLLVVLRALLGDWAQSSFVILTNALKTMDFAWRLQAADERGAARLSVTTRHKVTGDNGHSCVRLARSAAVLHKQAQERGQTARPSEHGKGQEQHSQVGTGREASSGLKREGKGVPYQRLMFEI